MVPESLPELRPLVTLAEARAGGLRIYQTGRPCPRGHIGDRYTNNNKCVACRCAEATAWIAANPERAKANHKAKYLANPEPAKARTKAWKLANPEKKRARNAAWEKANPEKIRAKRRRAYAADPHKGNEKNHRRRARKLNGGGTYTSADIAKLRAKQRNKCAFCLKTLAARFHIDHYIPLALGGSNGVSNLRILHPKCNFEKRAAHPIDHALKHGLLCW